jgi:exopolysaccharide biosynthesis polyprenyl glycosylphosphotransferase
VDAERIDTVVIASEGAQIRDAEGWLIECLIEGVEVIPTPVLIENLTKRIPLDGLGEHWPISMPLRLRNTDVMPRVAKRALDIAASVVGLLILAPLFPWIALAIYLESPGPIIYSQERVGRAGKIFRIHKFRSMIPDAEQDGPVWASPGDDRVTRVGRLLRASHLDELPQIWNVLRGEMSAVGPRPERPEFVGRLAEEIPAYELRHAVKPGMAGWAVIKQGYVASVEHAFTKTEYDLYYVKHQSLWFDLVILAKTVIRVATFRGR